MTESQASPALRGIRVLDLSRILAGPWATQLLADLGADVIKVEKPGVGDETRRWSPPSWSAHDGSYRESAYFLSANRGKKSIAIDFATPAGTAIIRELVSSCDVVVENFKKGTLARYGLDYDSLKALNPAIIYCSITGFGQTGPDSNLPGFDYMMQAMGGLMSITGAAAHEPDSQPQRVGVPIADLMTGMYASVAIMAALMMRAQAEPAQGQYIDLALFDVQLAMLANQGANYLATGQAPQRTGHQHPSIVPYQVFAASDAPLVIAAGTDEQFQGLCAVLGLPDVASDSRFASNRLRVEQRALLIPILTSRVLTFYRGSLIDALRQHQVPCGPVNDIGEALESPQSKARGMVRSMKHPRLHEVKYIANPIRSSATAASPLSAPPLLGQHTREVLGGLLSYSGKRLDELEAAGVIAAFPSPP